MKSIVTGATGFIGIALCRELLKQGEDVIAVIRSKSYKREKLEKLILEEESYKEKLEIIELDLENLSDLWNRYKIKADVFYHLAWNGSSGADREDFAMQYKNIQYTANAIETAKKCGCKKIVGAGSQAEYGVIRKKASVEETVPNPFMMYGAAKLAAYQMGKLVAERVGIKLIWTRIYSVYGVGENKGTLITYLIDELNQGKMPKLSECSNHWNFLYVEDCAFMLKQLGMSDEAEGIYHIASDDNRILREYVDELKNIVNENCELGYGMKKSDLTKTFQLIPDISRIKQLLPKEFTFVSFKEGIRKERDYLRYYQDR